MPSESVIAYARRLAQRQLRREDSDDVVAQALLDFVKADRCGRPCSDGLFLVIVRRRICDFYRCHKTEVPLEEAAASVCSMNEDHLLERTLREEMLRARSIRSRIDMRRILGVTRRVLEGATFAEACRAGGIPRGSQGRYRRALRVILASSLEVRRPPGR